MPRKAVVGTFDERADQSVILLLRSSRINLRSTFMNKLDLASWEKLGLWTILAVCLLPLVPYALTSLGS
jgi:uncharacterized membrane protein YdjX (TVP38/TMEM64 family)